MIAHLRGVVLSKSNESAVIDVNGVGYLVHAAVPVVAGLTVGEEARLHIHTSVREDAIQLFGFAAPFERDVFLKLTTVKGIGPKLAMAVLSGASLAELVGAVADGDVLRLTKIPGVGKKTAERILVELQEAFRAFRPAVATGSTASLAPADALADVRSALQNLGFKGAQVDRAFEQLEAAPSRPRDFDGLLLETLRHLR